MSIGIWRRLKRDRDIGRKAVLSDVKTAFTFTPALTKREGRTGRISARGLDSTDLAHAYKKDQGPIFSQYGPEQAWLIRDLLHD